MHLIVLLAERPVAILATNRAACCGSLSDLSQKRRRHDQLIPAPVIQMLLTKPTDRQHVKSLTTPDITYVSLSENNPELKRYLPWAGTNKGPDSIVKTFEGIGRTWETKAFEVREVIEQGETVAMFGSFTYRGRESGKEITSPLADCRYRSTEANLRFVVGRK